MGFKEGCYCPNCDLANWEGLCPHCSGDDRDEQIQEQEPEDDYAPDRFQE